MLMTKTRKNRNKGFTLVELIVVIAIIAVLSVIAVVAYTNISGQAENAAIASDANTVIRALNTFNALAASGQITDTTGITVAALQNLKLTAETGTGYTGGGVDMNLGVTITQERLTKVIAAILYDGTSKMWTLKPTTT